MVLLLAGGGLLLAAGLGQWTGLGGYRNASPRDWERFDPDLVRRTPDVQTLFQVAQARSPAPFDELPGEQAMQLLYEMVADRITHGNTARHTFLSNWIMWGLGRFNPYLSYIRDDDALLKHGHSGLCGQTASVLQRVATMAGIRARCVGIGGHIVMEAWYDDGWHLYDPDLEVVVRGPDGTVLSIDQLSQDGQRVRQAYADHCTPKMFETVVAGYADPTDNYVALRQGMLSSRAERAAQVLKFILPVVIILPGAWLTFAGMRRRPAEPGPLPA